MGQLPDIERWELILKTKVFYFNRYVTLMILFTREADILLS